MAEIDTKIENNIKILNTVLSKIRELSNKEKEIRNQFKIISTVTTVQRTPEGSLILDERGSPIEEYHKPKSPLAPFEEMTDEEREDILDHCVTMITILKTTLGIEDSEESP